jgi:hypothetical protein
MLKHKESWIVRIGRTESLRFTYERRPDDPIQLLGSVSRGARIGALGLTQEGAYVQVNGDHVSPLNASQIQRAIARARSFKPKAKIGLMRFPVVEQAPTVVVKRRRSILETSRPAAAGVHRDR